MEKLKSFFNNPKNTILMGLTINIIYFLYEILVWGRVSNIIVFIVSHLFNIGLIIYFSIIFLRLKGKQINIKNAQKILIALYIINLLMCFRNFNILKIAYLILFLLYLCGIFYKKAYINNKIFLIVNIAYIIIQISYLFKCDYDYYYYYYMSSIPVFISHLIDILSIMLTIPYFYNYYNLMKGSEK